jgi:3-oxoacyl-[acyl-carrier protein] reductase
MTGPLTGRTALVTGGSRGIGAATAVALASLGARVAVTYRTGSSAAESVAKQCRDLTGAADVIPASLDNADDTDLLIARAGMVSEEFDIVISNATTAHPRAPVLQLATGQILAKATADIAVAHRLAQGFLPGMHNRGFGRLIVISSGHSVGPSAPGMASYGVGKAALEALVRYIGWEEGHDGVTVNAVRPGFVRTDTSAGVPESVRSVMRRMSPAKRLAEPEDIAGVVALLAQPSAGWINGVCLPATGGMNHPIDWARMIDGHGGEAR